MVLELSLRVKCRSVEVEKSWLDDVYANVTME